MNKKIVIDNYSPYYLHPSEGLGVAITTVIVNGKNYNSWQQVVKTARKSKKN